MNEIRWTERDIQGAIIRDRFSRSFLMPNFTPKGWWECDVMEVTKAGYLVEHEVKVSRADFFSDRKKSRRVWRQPGCQEVKHELLASRECLPNRFFFACPEGLVQVDEVPEWAGLIEIRSRTPLIKKDAPRLHPQKLDPRVVERARINCYHRLIQSFIQNKGV